MSAPQVIALRTLQIATAGGRPGARDRAESVRMVAEKIDAFAEAWLAVALDAWLYPLKVGAALARSKPHAVAALPLPNAFGLALAPVHRKVKANAKRLARRRGRR